MWSRLVALNLNVAPCFCQSTKKRLLLVRRHPLLYNSVRMESEGDPGEHLEKMKKLRPVEELLKQRSESQITIEATVDTGFEFMAMEECRSKFGEDFLVLKERGSILFNIEKTKYPEVLQMRSVDNLYLVLSYVSSIGLKGSNTAEDLDIAKNQAHTPDWDFWLNVWKELSGFEGISKPTPEQYVAANERATKDKEAEKIRQAERQKKYKERQERNAEKQAKRKAKSILLKSQRDAARISALDGQSEQKETKDESAADAEELANESSTTACEGNNAPGVEEKGSIELDTPEESQADKDCSLKELEDKQEDTKDFQGNSGKDLDEVPAEDAGSNTVAESEDDEVKSLPDYEREIEKEVDAEVPPAERVLRFRATCFRVGKHCFGSMEVAREFGGELQDKFNWIVDLVNFNAEVILFLLKDSAQVSIALTKRSLHRRNISFFGPTTLRSTVCHNLLRLADIKAGDLVLDPLAGGGSIPIEGAMSFPGTFHFGGDNHYKAVSRFYSNVRCLKEDVGKGLALEALRWDSRRLPLRDACVDAVVTDLPFGVRLGSKAGNRNLYRRVLLDMARVVRPGTGRAILLTQDRKSFSLALTSTMGLWWQSKVMSVNIGGLDAAVFTLRRTSKIRPDESDLAAAAQPKEQGSWRGGPPSGGNRGGQRSWGRGGGRGRGRSYPRGRNSNISGNWREGAQKSDDKENLKTEQTN